MLGVRGVVWNSGMQSSIRMFASFACDLVVNNPMTERVGYLAAWRRSFIYPIEEMVTGVRETEDEDDSMMVNGGDGEQGVYECGWVLASGSFGLGRVKSACLKSNNKSQPTEEELHSTRKCLNYHGKSCSHETFEWFDLL